MKGPSFLLSYARDDDEDDPGPGSTIVRVVFESLRMEVARRTGLRPSAHASFIDVAIPVGACWEDQIHEGARTCDVFVAALSPSYFRREWCGREWAIYERRRTAAGAASAREIVPIRWRPFPEPPVAIPDGCLTDRDDAAWRDAAAAYTELGMAWLVTNRGAPPYGVHFHRIIRSLADRIVTTAGRGDLPPLAETVARTLAPAFGNDASVS